MEKRFSLIDSECRFNRACAQVDLLTSRLSDLQCRYEKACQENHPSFRYNLKLRLGVLERLRDMYCEYANRKAETVADLRRELFGEEIRIIYSDDTSDSESDEDEY